jgi:precorrin-6Y C5,15-methyltransferase (decarboxylating)
MPGTHGSSTEPKRVLVVGIGADGWDGLAAMARARIEKAVAVIGGQRHLELLPVIDGQQRLPFQRPLRAGLLDLVDQAVEVGGELVVLASGDPLLSGIGTTLIDLLGADAVEIVPAVSSVAIARARMGWPAEDCAVVSVVGRDLALVRRELRAAGSWCSPRTRRRQPPSRRYSPTADSAARR